MILDVMGSFLPKLPAFRYTWEFSTEFICILILRFATWTFDFFFNRFWKSRRVHVDCPEQLMAFFTFDLSVNFNHDTLPSDFLNVVSIMIKIILLRRIVLCHDFRSSVCKSLDVCNSWRTEVTEKIAIDVRILS